MTDFKEMTFEDFKIDWLKDITEGNPNTIQLGNRFSQKLVTQWLDISDDTDDIVFCDGSGDGGIDVAYLQRGNSKEENSNDGDIWYLIQSKYGSAFKGADTLLREAQKVVDTLDEKGGRLSSLAAGLIERLQTFRSMSSPKDKLVLVFASIESLSEKEKRVLSDIKSIGCGRIGQMFDVASISLETIYQRNIENLSVFKKYKLPFTANLVPSGNDLLVGSIKLTNLYEFLKDYKKETGDIDLLYEKNVRKFLGAGKKVNIGISNTLKHYPERFGLYNNGITVVVEGFNQIESDKYELTEPYIVNGCQTTRTIWETLQKLLESGGTGVNLELENWRDRLKKGIVVVKVVKVGEGGEELLTNTTRYTNSQNAVGQKDFIALEKDFRTWAKEMANQYDIFLEVQRGGWDSQKTIQRLNPNMRTFKDCVNAFDLLKTYGAAWLAEPGLAFSANPPFAPGGSVFKRIVETEQFGINDFYAAYLIQKYSQQLGFGQKASKPTRGQSRYLFNFVLIELLKKCMLYCEIEINNQNISRSVIELFSADNKEAIKQLCDSALNVIDDYLTPNSQEGIYGEPKFRLLSDMNRFLKWEKLGQPLETPNLGSLISLTERDMRRSFGEHQSVRDMVSNILKNVNQTKSIQKNNLPTTKFYVENKSNGLTLVDNYKENQEDSYYSSDNANEARHTKAPKTIFKVTFQDGISIFDKVAKNTFGKAIAKIGVDRVRKLNLTLGGKPLIMSIRDMEAAPFEISRGIYVACHSSTNEKIARLEQISELLDLGLIIEKVQILPPSV